MEKLACGANYIKYRSASEGNKTDDTFNFENNTADDDTWYTPLLYVYEAANCRMYFTLLHISNTADSRFDVAANAFGLNGIRVFQKCTAGSTNHPSSLPGNATLYDNGRIANVTTDAQNPGDAGSQESIALRLQFPARVALRALAVLVLSIREITSTQFDHLHNPPTLSLQLASYLAI